MKKINGKFDCLEEKEKIQAKIRKKISGATVAQEREFYASDIEDKKFASWVDKVKQRSTARGKLKKSS